MTKRRRKGDGISAVRDILGMSRYAIGLRINRVAKTLRLTSDELGALRERLGHEITQIDGLQIVVEGGGSQFIRKEPLQEHLRELNPYRTTEPDTDYDAFAEIVEGIVEGFGSNQEIVLMYLRELETPKLSYIVSELIRKREIEILISLVDGLGERDYVVLNSLSGAINQGEAIEQDTAAAVFIEIARINVNFCKRVLRITLGLIHSEKGFCRRYGSKIALGIARIDVERANLAVRAIGGVTNSDDGKIREAAVNVFIEIAKISDDYLMLVLKIASAIITDSRKTTRDCAVNIFIGVASLNLFGTRQVIRTCHGIFKNDKVETRLDSVGIMIAISDEKQQALEVIEKNFRVLNDRRKEIRELGIAVLVGVAAIRHRNATAIMSKISRVLHTWEGEKREAVECIMIGIGKSKKKFITGICRKIIESNDGRQEAARRVLEVLDP